MIFENRTYTRTPTPAHADTRDSQSIVTKIYESFSARMWRTQPDSLLSPLLGKISTIENSASNFTNVAHTTTRTYALRNAEIFASTTQDDVV